MSLLFRAISNPGCLVVNFLLISGFVKSVNFPSKFAETSGYTIAIPLSVVTYPSLWVVSLSLLQSFIDGLFGSLALCIKFAFELLTLSIICCLYRLRLLLLTEEKRSNIVPPLSNFSALKIL